MIYCFEGSTGGSDFLLHSPLFNSLFDPYFSWPSLKSKHGAGGSLAPNQLARNIIDVPGCCNQLY